LSVLRKLASSFLGIDLLAVGEYLETAIIIGNKDELGDALFVLGKQLFRQTDGLRLIPSSCAIFDADFHTDLLTM
jgi:hypothetical protein